MFESDDFDQVLSQFEFPGVASDTQTKQSKQNVSAERSHNDAQILTKDISNISSSPATVFEKDLASTTNKVPKNSEVKTDSQIISSKHVKRKIIHSFFDHQSKRKFPGPAGLLSGSFQENKDEQICEMELLSQDVDFSQSCLRKTAFDSPLWKRLVEDVKRWNLSAVETIKALKQQAISGHLRRRKAQTVIAFIETVDRSISDPLIILRDSTGSIKCTLHRDAWSKLSPYLVSEYSALVLWKPTILTTGSAFKKHYLNITLSNIYAVYSSAVINGENSMEMPDGYTKVYEEDFTVIKTESSALNLGLNQTVESVPETNALFDGLESFFSDEVF